MRRRTYLSAVGVALSGGLAGCSDSGPAGEGNLSGIFDEETPTAGPGNATVSPTATATGRAEPETPADTATAEMTGEPARAVEQFSRALADGDIGTAASFLHPESELNEQDIRRTATEFGQSDVAIGDVTVLDRDGDTALVAVSASVTRNGERETMETRFAVRLDGGRWKVTDEMYGRDTLTATPEPTARPARRRRRPRPKRRRYRRASRPPSSRSSTWR